MISHYALQLLSLFLGSVDATLDGQGKKYSTRFEGVTWDDDAWTLTTTKLDQGHYQSRVSLSNGYFGINLAAVGPFMDYDVSVEGDNVNGWPLFDRRQSFSTIAGFYDSQPRTNGTNFGWLYQYGWESVISGIPHWSGLIIGANGQSLTASVDPSQISGFSTTLDMKRAVMSWTYDWTPSGGSKLHVRYEMLIHKLDINQAAIQLSITPSEDTTITVLDVLDGDCAVRTDFVDKAFDNSSASISSVVSPNGLLDVKAYVFSVLSTNGSDGLASLKQVTEGPFGANQSSIAQGVTSKLTAGSTTSFTKFVGVASTDAFADAANVAKSAAARGAAAGWNDLLQSHIEEWAAIMPKDSVDSYASPDTDIIPDDENILELQINAVANPFHLIQNTIGENALNTAHNNSDIDTHSIAVCGLGSACYAGFIFWDADVWMAPGLVVSHPQAAKQIANYRSKLFPQAKKNIKTAYQSSQNATGTFSEGGAVFPWTNSRFGNCTGTGPCFDYEYHLNGDIGLQLLNYYVVTGDSEFFQNELLPIHDAVAWFYAELLTLNTTSGRYNILNATDPDEYANHVDNAGFTMALVKSHLETANTLRQRMGLEPNSTWADRSSKVEIPVNENAQIILEYSTMNGSISVKQADVTLIDDFLSYNTPYSLPSLDYYAGKQSLNGPGMTYGVFSIVANSISPSGCSSYTYDLYGSQPYARAPWFQYSEQLLDSYAANGGTHPAYPFLTGMGGADRVAVFGYLGLRLLLDNFNINPSLPPPLPYIRYRTIYWQGHPISAWSNNTHTTLTRLSHSLPNANSTFMDAPIPVTIGFDTTSSRPLAPNDTIVVPNRLIGFNASIDGNIAQCKPANSSQAYLPGQFPLAAIDGAISTKWQPSLSNVTSSVTVDLGAVSVGINVTGFHLDWAQHPPSSWQVEFSSSAEFSSSVKVYSSALVAISNPYNPAKSADITPYVGNTTDVSLPVAVQASRYVRLSISGNQGDQSDQGATVAEFAVLRQGGGRLVPNDLVHTL